MRQGKLTTLFSGLVIYSTLLSSTAFGQSVNSRNNLKSDADSTTSSKQTQASFKYLQDITRSAEAGQIASVEGVEAEVEKITHILASGSKKNVVLIDEYAGKRLLVVNSLAVQMLAKDAPANLRGKKILKSDTASLPADSKNQTEAATLFQNALNEVTKAGGKVVLYLEDISSFAKQNPLFGAEIPDGLRKFPVDGKTQVLSAGTVTDYQREIALDAQLKNRFQKIEIKSNDEVADDSFVGDKISPDLRELIANAAPNQKVKVILQSDDIKNPELLAVLKDSNVVIADRVESLNMLVVDLPVAAAEQVAALRGAKHLSLDREMKTLGHIATTTGLTTMLAQSGNSNLTGTGIGIAVVDSGVYEGHKSFVEKSLTGTLLYSDRVIKSVDFTGETSSSWNNTDSFGHGSHVAGLAAGTTGSNELADYAGIASNAKIINVRVLNSKGSGTSASLLQGIDWILNNRSAYNIRVVNMSLGTAAVESYKNDPLCRAARKLVDAGIVVVAAAGNNGKNAAGQKLYGAIHSPGNEPSVITVGATNTFGTDARSDDGIATYSSRGPTRSFYTNAAGVKQYDHLVKPDLVAPGNRVVSTAGKDNAILAANPSLKVGTPYDDTRIMMYLSGTSMATPIVSGTAALMLQANPKLTPNMVKMILMYSAQ